MKFHKTYMIFGAAIALCACASKQMVQTDERPANPNLEVPSVEFKTSQCGDVICQADERCIDNRCETVSDYPNIMNKEVCLSPEGCDCEDSSISRYGSNLSVKCSPGEACGDGGCYYVGGVEGSFLCKQKECACGTHRCGENQICAFDNCYHAGVIVNDALNCQLTSGIEGAGTSHPGRQVSLYLCPDCPSEIPPKTIEEYQYIKFDIEGIDSGKEEEITIGMWICERDGGCECGTGRCIQGAACIDGQCAINSKGVWFEPGVSEPINRCAAAYSNHLAYQPKVSEHYQIKQESFYALWMCDDTNTCICNGKKLPSGANCYGKKDGTELIGCRGYHFSEQVQAPQNLDHYRCDYGDWKCQTGECICDNKLLPKSAYCNHENIYCKQVKSPSDLTGYECFAENSLERNWICTSDKCLCGNKQIPKNAHCIDDKSYCYDQNGLSDLIGYECLENHKTWICTSDKCLCGDVELRTGALCTMKNKEYQCCGDVCFSPQTASEHDCIEGKWIVKAEEGQRHCQNKLLPAGTKCDVVDYQEVAVCGEDKLLNWDDYQCENNRWKCTLNHKPCHCAGKPLPEHTTCQVDKAFCGNVGLSDWDGYYCHHGKWLSKYCNGHSLKQGVICPSNDDITFADDVKMQDMESCEHVRGCLCRDKLCPPSGICTEQGCIDSLTDKTFEFKDGYLVSDNLQQCANSQGCQCGKEKIEYRDYCINHELHISMKSCVENKKRIVMENNYTNDDCEHNEVSWVNDCKVSSELNLSQYLIRDCLKKEAKWFGDVDVEHKWMYECITKEGCQCLQQTCQYGEVCHEGQCIADYQCHDIDDDTIWVDNCRPADLVQLEPI
ncbi:MAG: hypothetical protein J6S69_07195 [Proteobacteria bacterium]|nr:hypothetical protein [Pseudomonadota bacterium]